MIRPTIFIDYILYLFCFAQNDKNMSFNSLQGVSKKYISRKSFALQLANNMTNLNFKD